MNTEHMLKVQRSLKNDDLFSVRDLEFRRCLEDLYSGDFDRMYSVYSSKSIPIDTIMALFNGRTVEEEMEMKKIRDWSIDEEKI